MDYIRIKTTDNGQQTTGRDAETQKHRVSTSESTVNDIKELLKDWIKLYPDSFAPDVEFMVYQLEDGDIIIKLHEDLSSLAVALLVLYLRSTDNGQQTTDFMSAYITIDDTEVLLKQNIGKRAKLFSSQQTTDNRQRTSRDASTTQYDKQDVVDTSDMSTAVRFLLDDNYVLDYDFERKPRPVKDSGLQFEEQEIVLPEYCEIVRVGDVVKKNIDKVLEEEGLTPKKMLIYLLCGAIGLAIGFLIVHFTYK